MELTLRWAQGSKKYFEEHKQQVPWKDRSDHTQSLFGIIQGGMDHTLRKESARRTMKSAFPAMPSAALVWANRVPLPEKS